MVSDDIKLLIGAGASFWSRQMFLSAKMSDILNPLEKAGVPTTPANFDFRISVNSLLPLAGRPSG